MNVSIFFRGVALGALPAIGAVAVLQGFTAYREARHRQWALEDQRAKEEAAQQRRAEKEAERKRAAIEAKPRALRAALDAAVAAERSWVDKPVQCSSTCSEGKCDRRIEAWTLFERDFLTPLYGHLRHCRKLGFTPSVGVRMDWTREDLAQLAAELEKVAPVPA